MSHAFFGLCHIRTTRSSFSISPVSTLLPCWTHAFGAMAPWGLRWHERDRSDSSKLACWFLTSWCTTLPGILGAVYRKALVYANGDILKSRLSSSISMQSTDHNTHLECSQKRLEGWASKCSLYFCFAAGALQGFLSILSNSPVGVHNLVTLSPIEHQGNAANARSPLSGAM